MIYTAQPVIWQVQNGHKKRVLPPYKAFSPR